MPGASVTLSAHSGVLVQRLASASKAPKAQGGKLFAAGYAGVRGDGVRVFSAPIAGFPRIAPGRGAAQDGGSAPVASSEALGSPKKAPDPPCDLRVRLVAQQFCCLALAVRRLPCGSTAASALLWREVRKGPRRRAQGRPHRSGGWPMRTGQTGCARRTFGRGCDRRSRARTRCPAVALARHVCRHRTGSRRSSAAMREAPGRRISQAAGTARCACAYATAIFGHSALRPRAPPLPSIGASASRAARHRQDSFWQKMPKHRSRTCETKTAATIAT
jgi:hypothetical protein